MTRHGEKLGEITTGQLRDQLEVETNPKAIRRLVAAREYKAGLSPAQIEAKYGWPEQTIYSWLNRIENRPFPDSLYDDPPPGRPAKLTAEQFEQFTDALQHPPTAMGFAEPAWTSLVAAEFLREQFGVEYSRRHVRWLLDKAGVVWKRPRSRSHRADPAERAAFRAEYRRKKGR